MVSAVHLKVQSLWDFHLPPYEELGIIFKVGFDQIIKRCNLNLFHWVFLRNWLGSRISDGYRKFKNFLETYLQLPHLSFLDKSFDWLSYQQVKLHNIKDIEAQMNLSSFYLDRKDIKYSQTWENVS